MRLRMRRRRGRRRAGSRAPARQLNCRKMTPSQRRRAGPFGRVSIAIRKINSCIFIPRVIAMHSPGHHEDSRQTGSRPHAHRPVNKVIVRHAGEEKGNTLGYRAIFPLGVECGRERGMGVVALTRDFHPNRGCLASGTELEFAADISSIIGLSHGAPHFPSSFLSSCSFSSPPPALPCPGEERPRDPAIRTSAIRSRRASSPQSTFCLPRR